jgi:hypothetical protein
LKYEVAISEKSGLPIHFSGPFVGSAADITNFRECLKHKMIAKNYFGLADGTYQGESELLTVPPRGFCHETPEQREACKPLARRRGKVENLFIRMKLFHILKNIFRHNIVDHFDVFNCVLCIVKIDMEKGRPLWKVDLAYRN